MILSRAPLRIPIGGGGTDLPSYYSRFGGFFISAAIDKYVYVNVNRPASDDLIRVKYSRSEEVASPSELKHDLVRATLTSLGLTKNLEIASMADVPAGTGMGSSGSYLVALLIALHTLKRDRGQRLALAEEACRIEIELAAHPVGKQDQYVAAIGGLNCYEIDRSGEVRPSPLRVPGYAQEDLERSLLLYYTGQSRQSDQILEQQRVATEHDDRRVIESLHRTKELGHEIKAALEEGDLVKFGALLHQHWLNKKLRSERISDSRIDRIYETARCEGALGGKIMGAGGGGFLLLLCDNGSVRRVRDAIKQFGLNQMAFTFEMEGAKVLLDV
ncbi:MAG TPA: galactokinase [Candidatus Dormibacteraeota bacterium]